LARECAQGHLYACVGDLEALPPIRPIWRRFWTFRTCFYAECVEKLQQENRLKATIDPNELDHSLKAKLVSGALHHDDILLTDDEELVLRSYAPVFYRRCFVVERS
jgi:hypothetical protein